MAKFKKDGGKKKNKNSVFKKKVKVGRVIKKANETVPQVKVGKIIIKDQLAKLDDDFVKMPSNAEAGITIVPPHSKLLEIKKKIISELKQCASDAKPADKIKFLQKVKRALQVMHCNLSSVVMKVVLEKVCCPLMYDKNGEVRAEIPDLLKCLIVRYTEANKFKCNLFAVTSRSCPVFPVSLCRALSDSECCLDGLQVVGVACDLCPKLIQSDSANILCKLLTILYRQTYFQINHSSGEMKARNKYLEVEKLSQKTHSGSLMTWSLPRLIVDCNSTLLSRVAREALLNQLTRVLAVLSLAFNRCEYLAHPDNVMDDEVRGRFLAEICMEILCAAWRDLISTASNSIDSLLTFNAQSFNLSVSILSCMKATLEFVHSNCSSGKMFSSWLQSELSAIFEESIGKGHPYSICRRSNKNKELDESTIINKAVADIQSYFTKYDQD